MKKEILIGMFVLLLLVFGHFVYMKATSYECQTDIPPEPIYYNEEGIGVYVGQSNYTIETKCKGGILAKFPIN